MENVVPFALYIQLLLFSSVYLVSSHLAKRVQGICPYHIMIKQCSKKRYSQKFVVNMLKNLQKSHTGHPNRKLDSRGVYVT